MPTSSEYGVDPATVANLTLRRRRSALLQRWLLCRSFTPRPLGRALRGVIRFDPLFAQVLLEPLHRFRRGHQIANLRRRQKNRHRWGSSEVGQLSANACGLTSICQESTRVTWDAHRNPPSFALNAHWCFIAIWEPMRNMPRLRPGSA